MYGLTNNEIKYIETFSEEKEEKKEEQEEAIEIDMSNLKHYKQTELKAFCKLFGLAVSGNKTILCDRLKKYKETKG